MQAKQSKGSTEVLQSRELRKKFLAFFKRNGHEVVASSSIIPAEDPTILFANAGMNQFKDLFLGKEKRSYNCATTCQKCVRAGGKHNDLDNVGFTDRHLTFFEMLGNFSFGAYFKEKAIALAWEFLTKEIGIPVEKLSVTIHTSDDEAEQIWLKQIGVPKEKITRLGDKDNFWQMGDTGPCGPCTEIFYDRGADVKEDERHIEIWNNVFMQFERQADGSLKPLALKGVDTGMGLERLTMVLQGGRTVFDGDQFQPLKLFLEATTGLNYEHASPAIRGAFNVLMDHVRSSSLIIADGGSPSNEGRGYVLRKIIRRAALFASKLSEDKNLFTSLVPVFIDSMSDIYPELKTNRTLIETSIKDEGERFADNLSRGRRIFETFAEECKKSGKKELSGEQAFKLFDTFGFPTELTAVMAAERGLTVDLAGFEIFMERQREQSSKGACGAAVELKLPAGLKTEFVGYTSLDCRTKVSWVGCSCDGKEACSDECQDNGSRVSPGGFIVTEKTPFYAECGGQVSDKGVATIGSNRYNILNITKVTTSPGAVAIALQLEPGAKVAVGDEVHLKVDETTRKNTMKNHTAAHLLQAALVAVLGPQVKQAGSLVTDEMCRFDFSHHQAMTPDQIKSVELLANGWIMQAIPTKIEEMTLAEARKRGATAFFGEKYNPESVRVVQVPGVSAELCGGTHVGNTGEIGLMKIMAEEALGVGVRRITVVTGPHALAEFQMRFDAMQELGTKFSVQADGVVAAVEKESEHAQALRREVKALKKELLKIRIPEWRKQFSVVGAVSYVGLLLEDADVDLMRTVVADLIGAESNGVVFILAADRGEEAVRFVLGVGKDAQAKIKLDSALKLLADHGLRGGGKGVMAQGGGVLAKRDQLMTIMRDWIIKQN